MWTIYSKQFDGNYLFLFTFSITALRILICASLQASQYKFLTEMIFCFLNLSLCDGGIVAPSQESERAHLHQSRRSCVVLCIILHLRIYHSNISPLRKFLVFVECKEPEASHLVTETNLLLYQLHSSKSLCGVCLQSGT